MSSNGQAVIKAESLEENLPPEGVIFGISQMCEELRKTSQSLASRTVPILIIGETGTGKEVLAQHIHSKSPWHEGPFLKVNCSILRYSTSENDPFSRAILSLLMSSTVKAGPQGETPQGTLVLNEVALLEPGLQIRLLERLDEGHLVRISLPEGGQLNLRLICLTSTSLQAEIRAGTFLRNLYPLIDVIELRIPPLRKRIEDIPDLVDFFLEDYNRTFNLSRPRPGNAILNRMREYRWPGNVRELKNLMMRYVINGSDEAFSGELGARVSPPAPSLSTPGESLALKKAARQVVQDFERRIIRKVLEDHHWNRRETARALKISYRALLYKIKDAGVPPKRNTVARFSGQTPPVVSSLAPSPEGKPPS